MRSRFIRQVSVRNYANPSDTFSRAARSVPSIWTDIQIAVLEQVDAASLAVFRIIFGLVGVFIVTRFFAYGWIGELYIEPAHHFTYLGFSWVKPWPGWGMYAHFAALGLLACGIAAGYRYRLCAVLFFVGFAYVELLDKTAYLNHYYWAVLVSLLMAFLPLHSSLSVDSWRRSRNLWGTAPRGALWLLRAQLAAVYVFAGIAKLNSDWLLEAQPLHIWMQDHAGVPLIGPLLGEVWVAYVFSEGGAFFDLTIVGWLMWKRTRPAAYAVLVAFHLITYLLFPQIGVFSWLMMGTAPLFFPPDWPRRFLSNLGKRHTSAAAKSSTPPREYGRQNRVSTIGYGRRYCLCGGAGPAAAPSLRLPWKRAVERGRLPLCLAGVVDGESGNGGIPSPRPSYRQALASRPRGLSHSASSRADGDSAGYDTGDGPHYRSRFRGPGPRLCAGIRRCLRCDERQGER